MPCEHVYYIKRDAANYFNRFESALILYNFKEEKFNFSVTNPKLIYIEIFFLNWWHLPNEGIVIIFARGLQSHSSVLKGSSFWLLLTLFISLSPLNEDVGHVA